jgi:rhamnosyltransferase
MCSNSGDTPAPIKCAGPRVVAIIVAFDQTCNPLTAVEAVSRYVIHTVVVDNSPTRHTRLTRCEPTDKLSFIFNRNEGGLAGAYNRAIEHIRANHKDATHIILLDDDTDAGAIGAFLASDITRCSSRDKCVAAIAPAYVDRATGLRGTHIQLGRYGYRVLSRDLTQPTEVSFLINSMTLWNLTAVKRIGAFSTRLGIDHIDTDYCLRSKMLGYKLILNPHIEFLHSIGARRMYQFLGRTLQSGGHSHNRRKAIAENTVLLAKHYGWRFPSFAVLCVVRLAYECLGIVMAEDHKLRKLGGLARGIVFGMLQHY